MCGIVGYVGKQNATDVLIDGLRKLEYRGYDSAGIAVFENHKIVIEKAKGRLDNLEQKMEETHRPTGHCGIGHTRWATHGEPSDVNSHPHGNERVTIVHNGIIENYQQLKEKLEHRGYSFLSETDTESVAKLLDYYYSGDPIETLQKVISAIQGSYALGVMFKDNPGTIYAIRKESPLIVGVGKGENFIASDVPAIIKYTKDYYLLDENEIAVLTQDSVHVYDLDGEEIQKELHTANWDVEAAEKGGYPHFMIKEIHEQPSAFRNTVSPRIIDGLPDLQLENLSDEQLKTIERIHIVACGTAMHAGMVGKYVIEEMARIPVDVDVASEFRYRNPILGKNDLVVIISQSGETADTLAALRLAKQQGVPTLAIVNVVGSSIAREADSVCYTWAGPEIAVASTKAYMVQLSVMYLLAAKFSQLKGTLSENEVRSFCGKLMEIPDLLETVLEQADNCQYFASKFQNARDLFFIGRGVDYSLSLEGSLKLKEISYIHSEAYAAGELKHGTISLITDEVPVVAIATQQALYEKMISNVKEVKARGAKVLLICREDAPEQKDITSYQLRIPLVDDILMPLLTTVPLQLFAYYTAVLRGCDVDKPRNLAKSVTVE
ncbi:glutamine--fructose-6-phosphate transaminase (isomerizing) [Clostridium facile]|uniref:Glutamine--fructose-6-phosphate aminotransferase [isomerizing] n=1 Tax=Clostridium facile TaxID=2763035 RepID=A0ABR7ING0_9CLOT|nr:glutamine--fructose-6-phosphate transaminase (isomerizing) [Clostridium facile]MBC5786664.1 glutamine--fructose-6-phosphate transaminase (isomerizing) [Clostridium facile]